MQITAIISFVVHGALAYLTGTCMWRICTWCVTFEVGSHVLWVRFGWFTSKCSGKMSDRPVADASSPRRIGRRSRRQQTLMLQLQHHCWGINYDSNMLIQCFAVRMCAALEPFWVEPKVKIFKRHAGKVRGTNLLQKICLLLQSYALCSSFLHIIHEARDRYALHSKQQQNQQKSLNIILVSSFPCALGNMNQRQIYCAFEQLCIY